MSGYMGSKFFYGIGNKAFYNIVRPQTATRFSNMFQKALVLGSGATTAYTIFNEAEDWRKGKKSGASASINSGAAFLGFFAGAANFNTVACYFYAQTLIMMNLAATKSAPTIETAKPTFDLVLDALSITRVGAMANNANKCFDIYRTIVQADHSNLSAVCKQIDTDAIIQKIEDNQLLIRIANTLEKAEFDEIRLLLMDSSS